MTLEAWHDGLAHVMIAVTLHGPGHNHEPDAWTARIVLAVQAGAELSRLGVAADLLLRPS